MGLEGQLSSRLSARQSLIRAEGERAKVGPRSVGGQAAVAELRSDPVNQLGAGEGRDGANPVGSRHAR